MTNEEGVWPVKKQVLVLVLNLLVVTILAIGAMCLVVMT